MSYAGNIETARSDSMPLRIPQQPSGAAIASRISRFAAFARWGVFAAAIAGCGGQVETVPDDEAMRRARAERLDPEQAARDYFYPRKIVDYFPDMDALSEYADPAQALPDQLRDMQPAPPAEDAAEASADEPSAGDRTPTPPMLSGVMRST